MTTNSFNNSIHFGYFILAEYDASSCHGVTDDEGA